MRKLALTALFLVSGSLLLCSIAFAYGSNPEDQPVPAKQRTNFFIVNKIKGVDIYSRTVLWRAKLRSLFGQELVVIIARSSGQVSRDVEQHLKKTGTKIGTLWFDSHGRYSNGYSSFMMGNEEFSFHTIKVPGNTKALEQLSVYCDQESHIVIGSCYGGASFFRKKGDSSSRMNGDSLMMMLAQVFPGANIYGSESWVMTKPGIFNRRSNALSGYPLQKKFRDVIFENVWKRMGTWNHYSTTTNELRVINSIALTKEGQLVIKKQSYLHKAKSRKKLARNLKKLQPGLYRS